MAAMAAGGLPDFVVARPATGGRGPGARPPRADNVSGPGARELADLAFAAARGGAPLTTRPDACADGAGAGGACSSAPAVDLMRAIVPAAARAPPGAVVRAAAAALGCPDEACILTHVAFRDRARAAGVDPGAELETRFKPRGPRVGTELLSNFDIDAVHARWAAAFPGHHHCPFAMMDFASNGDAFGRADLAALFRGGASTFGCVVNTDRSSGPGKHWVAVFADARAPAGAPRTVEYFNSAGNPPPAPMVAWMERQRAALAEAFGAAEALAVTDVAHQASQTECGVYALYYIRRRLEGAPAAEFAGRLVPDDAMTAFRAHLFRA